jgi:3-oxoacyl-[acyl-carrier-protein] synthase I
MPDAARLPWVLAAGACTPLGRGIESSFAAQRAGLVAFTAGPLRGGNGEPVKTSQVAGLEAVRSASIRLEALALDALDDLRLREARSRARLGLFVGLPAAVHFPAEDVRGLLRALSDGVAAATGQAPGPVRSSGVGRSAFFFALHDALEALDAGECDGAIVGAVDSLCTPAAVRRLDREKRLLGAVSSDGLIPGEGAAFVLLSGPSSRADAARYWARLLCASIEREARHFGHEQPNTGRALSAALRKAFHSPPVARRRADLLYTCETGERYWTDELALAYFRNVAQMPEPFVRTTAAEAFGDLGAAAGAVQFAMGLQALARPKLSGGPNDLLLVCGASDDGHLGACLAQRVVGLGAPR